MLKHRHNLPNKGSLPSPTVTSLDLAVGRENNTVPKKRVITYRVGRLTKPWAYKGVESAIRALAGKALDGCEIRVVGGGGEPGTKP